MSDSQYVEISPEDRKRLRAMGFPFVGLAWLNSDEIALIEFFSTPGNRVTLVEVAELWVSLSDQEQNEILQEIQPAL